MNTSIINLISCGDRIIATLDCNGRRLASINGTHFSSLEAVKRALISLAGTYAGIAVLTVRNCTRGWRNVSALATMRRPVVSSAPAVVPAPRVGNQYLIPWAS